MTPEQSAKALRDEGDCEICGHGPDNPHPDKPWQMSVMNAHEILNGMGRRQKARGVRYASLRLCAWCNLYVVVNKKDWPASRQLAALRASRPEDYDLVAFLELRNPNAPQAITEAEVEQWL